MGFDKLAYPEIITIDGADHRGKRNMSKGQVLIPYTNKPKVGIGDVIALKTDKKDTYLKVTGASFIEDGSLGVGTDHPHMLALKVANTTAKPQVSKKQSSTITVGSESGEQTPGSEKETPIKTISMQHFMKHVAKSWDEESKTTSQPLPQNSPVDRPTDAGAPALSVADKKHKPRTDDPSTVRENMEARLLQTEDELETVAPVLLQLRPQFDLKGLVTRIKMQQKNGYKLAYVVSDGKVLCVAGFVTGYKLAWGKHIYIDDLVTHEKHRSTGAGKCLMEWFKSYAKENGCDQIHLDCSVLRFPTHKFYLNNGFHITSHHFSMTDIDS
jgi:GNAT superfamily N-acetyltransferase